MCGIYCRINPVGKQVTMEECRRAVHLLHHRGPDANGELLSNEGDIYFGFRRLAILDLSLRANQPMRRDTPEVLLFNGEIVNFRELRAELLTQGYTFTTDGDTEVLLRALQCWGESALERLVGMYAFVFWDPRIRRGYAVRDPLGIKPLYHWRPPGGGFCVASEAKAFYANSDFNPAINTDVLPEYVRYRSLTPPATLLKDVHEVPPGTIVYYDQEKGMTRSRTYWHPNQVLDEERDLSSNELKEILRESVHQHLVADVPVGAQFSGGVDSSVTTALARRELGHKMIAYHCSVKHPTTDELRYAEDAAARIGVDLRVAMLTSDVFLSELLDKLTWHRDAPLGHPNAVGVYQVSKLAKGESTVLLSGEGSDEIFAGYSRYSAFLRQQILRRNPPLSLLVRHMPSLNVRYYRALHKSKAQIRVSEDDVILQATAFLREETVADLLCSPDVGEATQAARRQVLAGIRTASALTRIQMFDLLTYLPGLLVRQDKMSMAASIENRVPFVTPAIAKVGLNLPGSSRCTPLQEKILLKKVYAEYVPRVTAERPKQGFGLPLEAWLTSAEGEARIEHMMQTNGPIFDDMSRSAIQTVREEFETKRRNAEAMWLLLSLDSFLRTFTSQARVLEYGGQSPTAQPVSVCLDKQVELKAS